VSHTVFVTGGRGFLGTALVEELERMGHHVAAPARIAVDLLDITVDRLAEAFSGCDTVVHAAADVGGLGYVQRRGGDLTGDNVRMSTTVLAAAMKADVSFLVGIGSACAYPGEACDSGEPLRESDLHDGDLHASVAAYGVTKRVLHRLGQAFGTLPGKRHLHVAPANLYGPGDRFGDPDRSHVLTALIEKVVAAQEAGVGTVDVWHPSPKREFVFIKDAARLIAAAMVAYWAGDSVPDDVVNIGGGVSHSIEDVLASVIRSAGAKIKPRWNLDAPAGVLDKRLDIATLQGLVGLVETMPLDDGIQQAMDAYKATRA